MSIDWIEEIESLTSFIKDKKNDGDIVDSFNNFSDLVMAHFQHVVQKYDDSLSAKKWLLENDIIKTLKSYKIEYEKMYEATNNGTNTLLDVDGQEPGSVDLGDKYQLLVFAHFCLLLDDIEMAKAYVHFSNLEIKESPSTKLWVEYANAMDHLLESKPYHVLELTLKGLEKHWVKCLELIEAFTTDSDMEHAIEEISKSFQACNKDKRLHDYSCLEGTGHYPVKWDFRGDSLLNFIKQRQ